MRKIWGIVPAAGLGRRMKMDYAKQYSKINNRYLIDYSLDALLSDNRVTAVMVSLSPNDTQWTLSEYANDQRVMTCIGGDKRQISVWNAMQSLQEYSAPEDWVLVHDAARPLLRETTLKNFIDKLYEDLVGGILAHQATDSIKQLQSNQTVTALERSDIYLAETPQMFRYQILLDALHTAMSSDVVVSDEASAVELLRLPVCMVINHTPNAKITYAEDLIMATALINDRGQTR